LYIIAYTTLGYIFVEGIGGDLLVKVRASEEGEGHPPNHHKFSLLFIFYVGSRSDVFFS